MRGILARLSPSCRTSKVALGRLALMPGLTVFFALGGCLSNDIDEPAPSAPAAEATAAAAVGETDSAAGFPSPVSAAGGSFVDNLGNSRYRYTDNHGNYVITLFPDGRYRYTFMSQNLTTSDSREGNWQWRQTGPNQGTLSLDDEVWDLDFVAPASATAKTPGDERTYQFAWERL